MSVTMEQAAEKRAAATRAACDRPRERRDGASPGAHPLVRATSRIELRDAADGGGGVHFTGYASVTGRGYEMWDWAGPYTELVAPGAFEKTLGAPGLDVPLVLGHDPMRRLARTKNGSLSLAEDETGLLVDAPSLDLADPDVAYIAPKLRSGLIDEMSFRFSITQGEWSPDWTEFHINEVDINRGDVAIVGYGANPYTSGELRSALRKLQAKRALDPEDVNMLTQALGWLSAVDSIVDEGQEALAAYLKVPSPDPDDMSGNGAAELSAAAAKIARALRFEDLAPRVLI